MCLQCHLKLSNRQVQNSLVKSLADPKFEQWNSTSMNHLSIAASGMNGPEAKGVAEELYEKLVSYSEEHPEVENLLQFYRPEVYTNFPVSQK